MTRLRELRLSRGFTQDRMARELGTSQQTISRIELENELVPTDILIRASEYFHVSVDYLLGLTDERNNRDCRQRLGRYMMEYEDLLMGYVDLNPGYKEVIKGVIKNLSEVQNAENGEA